MNPIIVDGFAFRIPGLPSRYRANCSKDFGQFVTSTMPADINCSKAEKAGFTRGSFVEIAMCAIATKVLTFKPHYENEFFTEIWGIPVGGEMKTRFHEKCSELSTFLIHRQSQDKLKALVETFGREVFNNWVTEGMPGDAQEYALEKSTEVYFNNIFRFEMTQRDGNYGPYFYISTTTRPIATPFEEAAVKAAKQICESDKTLNTGWCVDQRLVENQQLCLAMSSTPDEAIELAASPATRQIKGK